MKKLTDEQKTQALAIAGFYDPTWVGDTADLHSLMDALNGLTAESAEQREQGQAVAWRTMWAVKSRLILAAQVPPSLGDAGNYKRKADDLWRTVLLSDLQELLHHLGWLKKYTALPTPPAGVPDVLDMASDMQVAIANGDLPDQCEAAADWLVKTFAAPQPEDIPAIFKEQAS